MKTLTAKIITLFTVLVALSACKSNGDIIVMCSDVQPVNYEQTLNEVKWHLENKQCHYKFNTYFNNLLDAASGDPGPGYNHKFEQFLIWSQNQNIISKKDASIYYTQYFSDYFTGMDGVYNACSKSSQQTEIFAMLSKELKLKRIGIMDVMGNQQLYTDVAKRKADLERILEATWYACERQSSRT